MGPPGRAMVQTGTIAGDGDLHPEVGGAMVPGPGALQRVLAEASGMGLEPEPGLDSGMDTGQAVVELMVVVMGREVVPAAMAVVATVAWTAIIGHPQLPRAEPTMAECIGVEVELALCAS